MATRFTRVTIAGDDRQVDVSLPASTPLVEQVPMVLRLLSVPTTSQPQTWVLSTPELGIVPADRSLDDTGILDGMVLYLTPAGQAPAPPFVDDVEQTAGETISESVPAFTGDHRRSGIAGLLAALFVVSCWITASLPSPMSWLGASLIGIAALAVGAFVPEVGGTYAAATAVPAAAALVYAVDSKTDGVTAADWMLVATAASLALIAVGLVRALSSATAGGIVATVLALAAWLCLIGGVPPYRTAGLVMLLAVVAAGFAGQFALGGAGLVNLLVADERGEKVPRRVVIDSVRRGEQIATGVVWACAIGAALSVTVLMATPIWQSAVFAGLSGMVFALRSRMFSRVRQVVPMLLVPMVAVLVAATQVPVWTSMTNVQGAAAVSFGLIVLTATVLSATGFSSVAEVPGARLRRLFEGLEFVAVLALIPGLILLFDAIGAMQRWLG